MVSQKFLKELKKLNAKQREAVEAIEGPVMVLAGPGTGKTQILAMRIANILKETQTEPGNILALTFTNSGAWAMRKRLLEIIGPESYKIHVHTFHSFCNEIIQTFPEKFIFSRRLEQLNDLDQILYLRQIIDEANLEKIKTLKAPYFYQDAILDSITKLKQENIKPQNFKKNVLKDIETLNKVDDFYHDRGPNKGKIKAKYADQKEQLFKNLELAYVYNLYQEKLRTEGRYDFTDMILFVIAKMKKDHELLSFYQEKFQYILVDEYQDTNSAQNEVVELLAQFYENPNLCVVGDDEQSIFRFQGAALENILDFLNHYKQTKIIVLTDNYRSGQKILDLSRAMIEKNQNQIFNLLNINKKLESQNKIQSEIYLANFSNGQVEDFYLAEKIQKLIKDGVSPAEIACIYREHRDSEDLAKLLAKYGIPFSQDFSDNILDDLEIKKIINLLKIIDNPYNDAEIFEVMHYSFLKFNILDIYRVANTASQRKKSIFEVLLSKNDVKYQNHQSIKHFLNLVKKTTANFYNQTFSHAFEQILKESGFLNYLLKFTDAPIKLNRLKSLFDEIKNLNIRQNNLNLKSFLHYLNQLKENNLKIKEKLLDIYFQGVRLISAHQAKGLEFEHVFIFHLTDNHWGNKNIRQLIKLPKNLLKIEHDADKNEEERRLFYVGLTRAKKNLYLSWADQYQNLTGRAVPSQFLTELNQNLTKRINTKVFENNFTKRLKMSLRPEKFIHNKDLNNFLKNLAEKFVLSATSLNAYLNCPRQFFYNQLLRAPKVKNFSLAFGSAVHYALELFFKKQIKDLHLPGKKQLLNFFREGLKQEILTDTDFKRAIMQGQKNLSQYFDYYRAEWVKKIPVAAEYNFGYHHVHFDLIPITGKIDKIEILDKAARKVKIIDYKTTTTKSKNYLIGKTVEQDLSYLYQAFFYKLLAENDPLFPWEIGEVEFDFLTPTKNKFTKIIINIDSKEYEQFKQIVSKTYQAIQKLDFQVDKTKCQHQRFDCDYLDFCSDS